MSGQVGDRGSAWLEDLLTEQGRKGSGTTSGTTQTVDPAVNLGTHAAHVVCVSPGPVPDWREVLARNIETGRYTGHALAICDVCGEGSMLAIVNGSGTRMGLKSTPWPRCRMTGCTGRRVIADEDVDGVRKIKYRAARPLGKGRR